MSKTSWPDAAMTMTAWIAIALIVYSVSSCFSKSIAYRAKSDEEIKASQPVKEEPNHGVHFHLVEEPHGTK